MDTWAAGLTPPSTRLPPLTHTGSLETVRKNVKDQVEQVAEQLAAVPELSGGLMPSAFHKVRKRELPKRAATQGCF